MISVAAMKVFESINEDPPLTNTVATLTRKGSEGNRKRYNIVISAG